MLSKYDAKAFLFVSFLLDIVSLKFGHGSDVDVHLELGMQSLLNGQLADALSHYHLAVENDSKNYLTYFKRSTVFQAMGRYKSALDDLNESLKLNPDFLPARMQKAVILYRQGNLVSAQEEFELILHLDPENVDAHQYYAHIQPFQNDINVAEQLIEVGRCSEAIDILSRLLQEFYWSYHLKELRSNCYEQIGDMVNAIHDLRALTKMKSDNTNGFLKLSKLYYIIGEPEESLNSIRECLKLDPDHKECHNHYKKVKKLFNLYKSATEFASELQHQKCIEKLESALELENEVYHMKLLLKSKLCHCLSVSDQSEKALKVCTEVLEMDPNNFVALCDRGDANINLENYDAASDDFRKAANIDERSTRAKDGFDKAERLKKQSKKRDYYKILGVSRHATKKEITKAYRKKASKWHPDQYQGDEKKKAEKMFIDIAAAKEVLTDPEKRQKFDNGEDPLDPQQQNGNAFHPFTHFNQFSGSTFTFRFNF